MGEGGEASIAFTWLVFQIVKMLSDIVLQCARTLKPGLSEAVTTDQETTVVQSYKSLINNVKPVHSFKMLR